MCQYSSTTKSTLTAHLKSAHFPEKYPCKICDYVSTRKDSLSTHTRNVHQSERINCIECNKSFKHQGSLKQHTKLLHSGPQTEYICNICPFKTIRKSALKTHSKNIHFKPN